MASFHTTFDGLEDGHLSWVLLSCVLGATVVVALPGRAATSSDDFLNLDDKPAGLASYAGEFVTAVSLFSFCALASHASTSQSNWLEN